MLGFGALNQFALNGQTFPVAVGDVTISVPTGVITLTTYPPVITAGGEVLVEVPTGIVTLTGYAPDVYISKLTEQDIQRIVDSIFSRVIENGETFEEAIRLIRAEAAGKLAVAGNTVTIRDAADSKDRITATVDSNGQRTAIITDAT